MDKAHHARRLVCLVALVACSHLWLVSSAQAPAPDTLRFIRFAKRIGQGQFVHTLCTESDHPLFPLAVWVTEGAVRVLSGGESPEGWQLAAQLAATISGLLLVVPLYGLTLELFGARIAFWSALVFVLLPIPNRVTADGLSDGLHLLWFTTGIWTALLAHRRRQWPLLVLTGVLAGLGFWTRPEAVILTVGVLIWTLALACVGTPRWPWKLATFGLVGLVVSFALTIAPYILLKGKISDKASFRLVLALADPPKRVIKDDGHAERSRSAGAVRATTMAARAGDGVPQWTGSERIIALIRPWIGAMDEVLTEFLDAGHYVFPFFALWALVVPWAQRSQRPAAYLLGIVAVLFSFLLMRLHITTGYVATRHMLVLVVMVCPWIGSGLVLVVDRLTRVAQWCTSRYQRQPVGVKISHMVRFTCVGLVACGCIPKMLEPMHLSRWGFRQAAVWLEQNGPPSVAVLDHHAYAAFYSGLKRYGLREFTAAVSDPQLRYVVVISNDLTRNDPRYSDVRHLVSTLGRPAASFPLFEGGEQADVFVYRCQPVVAITRLVR